MLTEKKIKPNTIDKTIENEKKNRIEAEKKKFEKIQMDKRYESIKNFKNSIQESKNKKNIIKKETQDFITNILNSIDHPTIKLSKDNEYIFDFENNHGDISNLLNKKITKQEANVISKKYIEAFTEEMKDLDDYVVMDNLTETGFKDDGDKVKKVLVKPGTGKDNPYFGDYEKDVEDIKELLKVFQTKINNVKNGASTEEEKNLGRELQKIYDKKEDEYKSQIEQMFEVKASPNLPPNNPSRKVTEKKKKAKRQDGPITVQKILNKMQTFYLNKDKVGYENIPNDRNPNTLPTLLATTDVNTASETLQSINMTSPYKNRKYTVEDGGIVQAWGIEMSVPEKLYYTQMLIRKLYPEFENTGFKIKLTKKK